MGASSCETHPHMFVASRTQYYDHKTAINFSRLESFAIFIALFLLFSLLGHMLSELVVGWAMPGSMIPSVLWCW